MVTYIALEGNLFWTENDTSGLKMDGQLCSPSKSSLGSIWHYDAFSEEVFWNLSPSEAKGVD